MRYIKEKTNKFKIIKPQPLLAAAHSFVNFDIDFKNLYNVYSLLLYGHFFNKYEQIDSNSEYLTLDFINSFSKLSIKDIDDKQLESIQIKLLKRMEYQTDKYIRRLKEVIIDAAIERGIVDLYKNEIKSL